MSSTTTATQTSSSTTTATQTVSSSTTAATTTTTTIQTLSTITGATTTATQTVSSSTTAATTTTTIQTLSTITGATTTATQTVSSSTTAATTTVTQTAASITTTQNRMNTTMTTQPIITGYSVQFSFPLNISDGNMTDNQLVSELTSIFINALGISSNQINITVITRMARIMKSATVQVRFFSTAYRSADDLLISTEAQVANSSSQIRQSNLTAQLNENSIVNRKRFYSCPNNIVQESPCTTTSTSTSGTSLTTILLASIIPSIFALFLLVIAAVFLIKYFRGPVFKPRTTRFDRF